MVCACIDIGSNTTRMLVADVRDGSLRELEQRRAFTRIGADISANGRISGARIDDVAAVVSGYRELATRVGAERLRTVATAAVRDAANGDELLAALESRCGIEAVVLSGIDEARLAFLGATRTLDDAAEGVVGVVDVGGRSTEIAVGTVAGGVTWSRSLPVGSSMLSEAHAHTDPATPDEVRAMAADAAARLRGVPVPPVDQAVAVGGSATSLRRVVGPRLDAASAAGVIERICDGPAHEVARRLELDAERVRLLPAGILILAAVAAHLDRSLLLGCGGIREGVCLELAAAAS